MIRSIAGHSCLNIMSKDTKAEKQEQRRTIRGKNIWGGWLGERGRVKGVERCEKEHTEWLTWGEGVLRGLRRQSSNPVLRWACAIELERWKGIREKRADDEDVVSSYLRGNGTARLLDIQPPWSSPIHSVINGDSLPQLSRDSRRESRISRRGCMRTCACRNLPRGGGWQEGFEEFSSAGWGLLRWGGLSPRVGSKSRLWG